MKGALFFLLSLAVGGIGVRSAAADEDAQDSSIETSSSEKPNQDLLLFWEEKELYVETATRTAKPISQVAENMEIVTAKDIAEMNAHNVAEVLNRVPGLYVDFTPGDLNTTSSLHIQGSSDRHVTVLVDGVFWNFMAGGNAEVSSIPIQIIDRIEIQKGPASSAWGSALGGVINIITKGAGDTLRPKGMASASYGKRNTQDYNGEVYGKAARIGYYLFAGRQDSDGLANGRDYSRNSFYGKLTSSPVHDLDLAYTVGYSDPNFNAGNLPSVGLTSRSEITAFFTTGSFEYRLTPDVSLRGGAYLFDQKMENNSRLLSDLSLFKHIVLYERTIGSSLKLTYTGGVHSAVVGVDASYGDLDQTSNATVTRPSLDKWALFTNDTVSVDSVAITPGLRFDHNNVSGSFVSPSLGATYEISEHAIVRASVARGFTSPPLSATSGGGFSLVPNPDLTAEYGWSYQAGVESALMDYLNLKANLFRHDTRHELGVKKVIVPGPVIRQAKIFVNGGSVVRQGYELQAETAPIYNVSLKAAHSFVHIDADSQAAPSVNYSYQLVFKYDDRKDWLAELTGTYVWWNLGGSANAKYNSFIWDLNINKRYQIADASSLELFFNVHNLFNSDYYTSDSYKNPSTWAEAGVKVNF